MTDPQTVRMHDEQLAAFQRLGYVKLWTRYPSAVLVEMAGATGDSLIITEGELHLFLSGLAIGAAGRTRPVDPLHEESGGVR